MTIVKELNNLSEKITGENAKATTDAQAVKFISDNYTGGGSGNNDYIELDIDTTTYARYFGDPSKYGTPIEVTNEDDIAKITAIDELITANYKAQVKLKFPASTTVWYYNTAVGLIDNEFAGMSAEVIDVSSNIMVALSILKSLNKYYLTPQIFTLTPYSG